MQWLQYEIWERIIKMLAFQKIVHILLLVGHMKAYTHVAEVTPTILIAPHYRKQVGRSKKKRNQGVDEGNNNGIDEYMMRGGKLSRMAKYVKCSKCNNLGHNARTCKAQPTNANNVETIGVKKASQESWWSREDEMMVELVVNSYIMIIACEMNEKKIEFKGASSSAIFASNPEPPPNFELENFGQLVTSTIDLCDSAKAGIDAYAHNSVDLAVLSCGKKKTVEEGTLPYLFDMFINEAGEHYQREQWSILVIRFGQQNNQQPKDTCLKIVTNLIEEGETDAAFKRELFGSDGVLHELKKIVHILLLVGHMKAYTHVAEVTPTILIAPHYRKQVGRSKKKRNQGVDEGNNNGIDEYMMRGGKLSRMAKYVKCSKCNNLGHNARTCKAQPTNANNVETIGVKKASINMMINMIFKNWIGQYNILVASSSAIFASNPEPPPNFELENFGQLVTSTIDLCDSAKAGIDAYAHNSVDLAVLSCGKKKTVEEGTLPYLFDMFINEAGEHYQREQWSILVIRFGQQNNQQPKDTCLKIVTNLIEEGETDAAFKRELFGSDGVLHELKKIVHILLLVGHMKAYTHVAEVTPTILIAPHYRKQVGRSKKKRNQGVDEGNNNGIDEYMMRGGKLSRMAKYVKCSKCNNLGHNARTCKAQPTNANNVETIGVKKASQESWWSREDEMMVELVVNSYIMIIACEMNEKKIEVKGASSSVIFASNPESPPNFELENFGQLVTSTIDLCDSAKAGIDAYAHNSVDLAVLSCGKKKTVEEGTLPYLFDMFINEAGEHYQREQWSILVIRFGQQNNQQPKDTCLKIVTNLIEEGETDAAFKRELFGSDGVLHELKKIVHILLLVGHMKAYTHVAEVTPTILIAPHYRKQVGRSKKKRNQGVDEGNNNGIDEYMMRGGKLSRMAKYVKCSKCNNLGHNARTCKAQPTNANNVETIGRRLRRFASNPEPPPNFELENFGQLVTSTIDLCDSAKAGIDAYAHNSVDLVVLSCGKKKTVEEGTLPYLFDMFINEAGEHYQREQWSILVIRFGQQNNQQPKDTCLKIVTNLIEEGETDAAFKRELFGSDGVLHELKKIVHILLLVGHMKAYTHVAEVTPTILIAPHYRKQVGRSKKKRNQGVDEGNNNGIDEYMMRGGKLSRMAKYVKCSKCNNLGHNARTCKAQPTNANNVETIGVKKASVNLSIIACEMNEKKIEVKGASSSAIFASNPEPPPNFELENFGQLVTSTIDLCDSAKAGIDAYAHNSVDLAVLSCGKKKTVEEGTLPYLFDMFINEAGEHYQREQWSILVIRFGQQNNQQPKDTCLKIVTNLIEEGETDATFKRELFGSDGVLHELKKYLAKFLYQEDQELKQRLRRGEQAPRASLYRRSDYTKDYGEVSKLQELLSMGDLTTLKVGTMILCNLAYAEGDKSGHLEVLMKVACSCRYSDNLGWTQDFIVVVAYNFFFAVNHNMVNY
ncbi:hypothetical protein LXL04_016601 [Taraxacum kok-saghyz]